MEHYKNGRFTRSAVAKHVFESGHQITSADLTLLKATENHKIDACESLFIHLYRNKILNNEPGIINSKLFHTVEMLSGARISRYKSPNPGISPHTVGSHRDRDVGSRIPPGSRQKLWVINIPQPHPFFFPRDVSNIALTFNLTFGRFRLVSPPCRWLPCQSKNRFWRFNYFSIFNWLSDFLSSDIFITMYLYWI
jgi:hypothetical protein